MSIPRVILVLGPTASGKSALAVKIALWLERRGRHAEIISADSRQVYRGLDIGTCKITKREMCGIPHHMLNIASPKRQYGAARYASAARAKLRSIVRRGRTPIICGGSGQYIDALLGAHSIPNVPPDPKLRIKLAKLSAPELFAQLRKLDPRRARTIDRHNPRRLIRALEIVLTTGRPVSPRSQKQYPYKLKDVRMLSSGVLKIGLALPPSELQRRIDLRLGRDIRRGLIGEVKRLRGNGLSWKRLDELGLEYRIVARYLRGRIRTKEDLLEKLQIELRRYVKRQLRWWKCDRDILWAESEGDAMKVARVLFRS